MKSIKRDTFYGMEKQDLKTIEDEDAYYARRQVKNRMGIKFKKEQKSKKRVDDNIWNQK